MVFSGPSLDVCAHFSLQGRFFLAPDLQAPPPLLEPVAAPDAAPGGNPATFSTRWEQPADAIHSKQLRAVSWWHSQPRG